MPSYINDDPKNALTDKQKKYYLEDDNLINTLEHYNTIKNKKKVIFEKNEILSILSRNFVEFKNEINKEAPQEDNSQTQKAGKQKSRVRRSRNYKHKNTRKSRRHTKCRPSGFYLPKFIRLSKIQTILPNPKYEKTENPKTTGSTKAS